MIAKINEKGSLFLMLRAGNEKGFYPIYCPLGAGGLFCGTWCKEFKFLSENEIKLCFTTLKVEILFFSFALDINLNKKDIIKEEESDEVIKT